MINSTAVGGGVAEILNRMLPLLKELEIDIRWEVIKGGEQFFDITKKIHNALHGKDVEIGSQELEVYLETNKANIQDIDFSADVVFIHDPQPAALIEARGDVQRWIWRCHIDLSQPQKDVWNFLKKFILKYDATVFSAPSFSQKLPLRQFLIPPSIDPLSEKNKPLPQEVIDKVLEKYQIPDDKPIITQISRFDRLKDPVGVIQAYKMVKRYNDCRLVLAGGTASDDPEGQIVYEEVKAAADSDPDIHIILMPHNDLEVNALQRASAIIVQKSIREGFGLTVTEALWKAKPVVACAVGGIPLQIKHKYSGLLCHSIEGAAFAIKQLLNNPEYAQTLGRNGREHVKNNFLLTRHLRDYLLLFLSLFYDRDVIYL
ncbi:MAG: glycosyl transferase family 1 [Candidatus Omnitrophica bacterium 4484_49]|nr:MAG: glycosyl transferase family 1 [Candidatus Omnitrophica bacterium 4484_49]